MPEMTIATCPKCNGRSFDSRECVSLFECDECNSKGVIHVDPNENKDTKKASLDALIQSCKELIRVYETREGDMHDSDWCVRLAVIELEMDDMRDALKYYEASQL
jgi:hypothetical protein